VYGWRILFLGAGVAFLALGQPLMGVFVVTLGVQRLCWQLGVDFGVRASAVLRVSESLALAGSVTVIVLAVGAIMAGEWSGWVFAFLGLGYSFLAAWLLWATFRVAGLDSPEGSRHVDLEIEP